MKRCLLVLFLLLLAGTSLSAQDIFSRTDSLQVVAQERFSRRDFFLFYPLKPSSWHPTPNPLDSLSEYPLYHPKGDDVIYFSAPDRAGTRSLFITEDLDSLWRAPRLLGEALLSTGSEVFPLLSPDGRTLYFASDGLPGLGGFDLFASAWDEDNACWGEPVNMGAPFNSPADDFLLMDTEDGKYTLFASNRECARDSVYIYVLDYAASLRPQAEAVDSVSLLPVLYARKMEEARALRDSIYKHETALDELRLKLSKAGALEQAELSVRILTRENALQPLKRQLETTREEIRQVEQCFLQGGVASSAEVREMGGDGLSYTFAKNALGGRLKIKVAPPPAIERSFRVAPVGRFAMDNSLPEGIVYQIQVMELPRHATLEDIRGLSPVYERLGANLRYGYSVGAYSTYVSALQDLNVVRCLGFPEARIVAYRDGRPIPVNLARQEE